MIHHKEIQSIIAGVLPPIKEFLDKSLATISTRLAAVEARAPEKGDPGLPGEAGKDADPALIEKFIGEAVAKIALPENGRNGEPGKDGVNGKDVDPEIVKQFIADEVAKIPQPINGKDGEPGTDGRDGVAGKDADPAVISQMVSEAVSNLPEPDAGKDGADGLKADECYVPDDLALMVGKAIGLLAESPPIVPKSAPLVVNVVNSEKDHKRTERVIKRDKDGTLRLTEEQVED